MSPRQAFEKPWEVFGMSPGGHEQVPGWLAGHRCSEIAGSSLVRRRFVSPRQDFREPWEVSGMSPGGHEQVPGWLMMAMGGVGQPASDLSLRVPLFGAIGRSELTFSDESGPSDALAGRLCSEIVQGRVKVDLPPGGDFICFGPWAGNLKGGVRGPLLLIQYTCCLILDNRHLILETCTYTLDT